MAEGDGPAVDVDLVLAQAQQLEVGERDDAEGLVDLEGVDGGLLHVRVRERFRDRERRRRREPRGLLRGVAPAEDPREGRERVGF